MKSSLRLVAAILGGLSLSATVHAKATNKEVAAYQQRLDELEQRQKVLERNLELEAEKKKELEKERVVAGAGQDGFYLKSADGKYQLRFRGYIQADARFFFDDSSKKPPHTFLARRIRPILEGTLSKYFDFRFMPDFGEGKVVIQDAYFDTKIMPEFKIRVGKFKEPVGLERLQSATSLTFIERATPTALVPNRDLGIQLFGEFLDGALTYEVGVFNGVVDGGSGDLDLNSEKDFAGRVFALPFKKTSIEPLQNFGIGIAGTVGKQNGSEASPNLASYKDAGQQTVFSYRNDGTPEGTTIADGTRYRVVPQGYFYYKGLGLLGEYALSSQTVKRQAERESLLHQAWQLAASYVFLGGDASYKGVNPKKPLGWTQKGTGAFEIAARYSELDIDQDAFPIFADPNKAVEKARAWALGFNWYLNKNAKFALTYEQTHFRGGAAEGGDRPTEKVLFNRYQIAF